MTRRAKTTTNPNGTVNFGDGIANLITSIGANNPALAGNFYAPVVISDQQLEAAYVGSTWFGKIIDIPADDATKNWRTWSADKVDSVKIFEAEQDMSIPHRVREALVYARLYGGSVMLPLGLPGETTEPFDVRRTGRGMLKGVAVVPRPLVTTSTEAVMDPLDPYYGRPQSYTIGGRTFHPSRVIHLNGKRNPSFLTTRDPWGVPVYVSLMDSLRYSEAGAAVMSILLNEAKTDIVSIKDFMAHMVNPAMESLYIKRFELIARAKSIANVTLLDGEDKWEQKQINFSGLPDVVFAFLTMLAGAADIPVTRLLGTSAKGLNATGEGDEKNYFENVGARQRLDLSPQLRVFDEMFLRSVLGTDPKSISHEWTPLKQMSVQELAAVEKLYAETNTALVNAGNVDVFALGKAYERRMIESGAWPGFEQAREESEAAGELPDVETDIDDPTPAQRQPVVTDAFDFSDMAPRSLYVRRDVVNVAAIARWAKEQGFEDVVDDMHVTIIHSREAVDWFKTGAAWDESITIPAGGARMVEEFNGGAQVLRFTSPLLEWRHREFLDAGAKSDYPEFKPHITISYKAPRALPGTVIPYRGEIVLGPEIYEEVRT